MTTTRNPDPPFNAETAPDLATEGLQHQAARRFLVADQIYPIRLHRRIRSMGGEVTGRAPAKWGGSLLVSSSALGVTR